MTGTAAFKYPLEALLKARQLELDRAKADEQNARRLALEHEAQAAAIRRTISDLEQEMREMLKAGQALDLQLQQLRARYLTVVRERLASKLAELKRAQDVHEQTLRALRVQSRSVRALERHRETRLAHYQRDAERAEQKSQDELWLSRIAGRG